MKNIVLNKSKSNNHNEINYATSIEDNDVETKSDLRVASVRLSQIFLDN